MLYLCHESGLSTTYKTNTSLGRTICALFFYKTEHCKLTAGRGCAFSWHIALHPDRSSIFIDTDDECICINGKLFFSRPAARGFSQYEFNGRRYVTAEEVWVAKMLTARDIPFLYEVEFTFTDAHGRTRIWCPDFVFPWQKWLGRDCHKSAILGIEVKRGHKPLGRSLHLQRSIGVPILMQTHDDLIPYYKQFKREGIGLPMRPIAQPV